MMLVKLIINYVDFKQRGMSVLFVSDFKRFLCQEDSINCQASPVDNISSIVMF